MLNVFEGTFAIYVVGYDDDDGDHTFSFAHRRGRTQGNCFEWGSAWNAFRELESKHTDLAG